MTPDMVLSPCCQAPIWTRTGPAPYDVCQECGEPIVSNLEAVAFTDPISGQRCELVTTPEAGIRHPECDRLANLAAHLDAFYCAYCRMNGRISGAWALEMIRKARGGR
jgi:hypothetical protein